MRFIWSAYGISSFVNELIATAKSGRKVIWLVPEPYSHSSERILTELGGANICLNAEVLTFGRLCDRMLTELGGIAKPHLDTGGRLLTLLLAVNGVSHKLSLLGKAARRADFLFDLLDTYDRCKNYLIRPETLMNAAGIDETAAGQKLRELSFIFSAFEAYCGQSGMDGGDKISAALKLLDSYDYDSGISLYVSFFISFTPAERALLTRLASRADNCSVHLAGKPDNTLFQPLIITKSILSRSFPDSVDEVSPPPEAPHKCKDLLYLCENWTSPDAAPINGHGAAELYYARTASEECRFAAERITLLVNEAGLRFRDISVLTSDHSLYTPIMEAVFPHYGVKMFSDSMDTLDIKPLCRAIRALADRFQTGSPESLVDLARSGLTPEPGDSLDLFESYLVRWRPRDTARQWERSPRGFVPELNENDADILVRVNSVRLRLNTALNKIPSGSATVQSHAPALYEAFLALGAPQALEARITLLEEAGEGKLAAETAQMWELFCSALEQCSGILDNTRMKFHEFAELMLLVLSGYKVGSIPSALDRVQVGELGRFSRTDAKAVIILGADGDSLPARGNDRGLLTPPELSLLEDVGAELPPGPLERLERELYNIYSAVALPEEYLIICRSGSSPPSEMYKTVERLLSVTPQPVWPDGYPSVAEGITEPERNLSPGMAARLYGNILRISPSRAESYFSCPYTHFARHGLLVRERAEYGFAATDVGLFVHNVFARLAEYAGSKGGFRELTRPELHDYAVLAARETAGALLKPGTSGRIQAQCERMARHSGDLADYLYEELSIGNFVPDEWETRLDSALREIPSPETAVRHYTVGGVADRLDKYVSGETEFLRVVDYKTGGKRFSLRDVYDGLNMQMLIYLFLATERRSGAEAGMLYMPARDIYLTADTKLSREEAVSQKGERMRRSGLLLSNDDVLAAMDPSVREGSAFLPVYYSKPDKNNIQTIGKKSAVATAEEFSILRRHVNTRLDEMALGTASGIIEPKPLVDKGEPVACTYCRLRAACMFDAGTCEGRERTALKDGEIFDALRSIYPIDNGG